MDRFDNIQEATTAITVFMMAHGAARPEFTRDIVIAAMSEPSPVVQIMDTMEAFYAIADDLPKAGKNLVGGLALLANEFAWHGIREDDRGVKIARAMQRELGEDAPEGVTWPAAEDDPKPISRFIENPEPVAPVAPAEG